MVNECTVASRELRIRVYAILSQYHHHYISLAYTVLYICVLCKTESQYHTVTSLFSIKKVGREVDYNDIYLQFMALSNVIYIIMS